MAALDAGERLSLLGRSEAGRPITLSNGMLVTHDLLAPHLSPATFRFDLAFIGAHFPNLDHPLVTELAARIPTLDHWLGISGLRIELVRPRREVSIHFSEPESLGFELEPGLELVFDFDWRGPSLTRPQLEANLRQEVWLVLRAVPPRAFQELRNTLRRLLNLFSLLVGEPIDHQAVVVRSPRVRETLGRQSQPTRIEVLSDARTSESVETVVPAHRMLLRFGDVQGALPGLFQRWLSSYYRLEPAFDIYFALQRRDPGHQEQRFLGLVQSLESLHRLQNQAEPTPEHRERLRRITDLLAPGDRDWLTTRLAYSHEPSLKSRFRALIEPFASLFGGTPERRRFLQKVVDTRNYLTHYNPSGRSRAVEPSELLPYLFRLRVLFILHCLVELGFVAPEAQQLVESNHQLQQMVRFGRI